MNLFIFIMYASMSLIFIYGVFLKNNSKIDILKFGFAGIMFGLVAKDYFIKLITIGVN